MTVKNILQLVPEELDCDSITLRVPAVEVVDFDDELKKIVRDLVDTLHFHDIAIGLAAPQIGINLRIAVINLKNEGEEDVVIINPKIISESGKKDKKNESCMSLPHYCGEVTRRSKLLVSYQDIWGEVHEKKLTGFRARVYAHEIDHLDGILYTDRMDTDSCLHPIDIFH